MFKLIALLVLSIPFTAMSAFDHSMVDSLKQIEGKIHTMDCETTREDPIMATLHDTYQFTVKDVSEDSYTICSKLQDYNFGSCQTIERKPVKTEKKSIEVSESVNEVLSKTTVNISIVTTKLKPHLSGNIIKESSLHEDIKLVIEGNDVVRAIFQNKPFRFTSGLIPQPYYGEKMVCVLKK